MITPPKLKSTADMPLGVPSLRAPPGPGGAQPGCVRREYRPVTAESPAPGYTLTARMSGPQPGEITRLLHRHRAGDAAAFDRLVTLVYSQLRGLARRQLRGRGPGETLDTTALVHEVYLQLVEETGVPWQDRGHFFAIAARAMRRIVVDHLRHRLAQKRGGGVAPVDLDVDLLGERPDIERVLAVDRALDTLAGFNPRLTQILECRFFAGMTREETAAALGISVRTVERDWTRARAWLRRELR